MIVSDKSHISLVYSIRLDCGAVAFDQCEKRAMTIPNLAAATDVVIVVVDLRLLVCTVMIST